MPTILVIDDEAQIRLLFKYTLEKAGFDVLVANDGKDGLNVLTSEKVDVVITDIIMPEKEGLETILTIHNLYPHIKVIAVSGGGNIEPSTYLASAKIFGADRAFSKPVIMNELLEAINELLADASQA